MEAEKKEGVTLSDQGEGLKNIHSHLCYKEEKDQRVCLELHSMSGGTGTWKITEQGLVSVGTISNWLACPRILAL